MSMLKEFRDFAIRGNVIDLAVAVIIGGAFGKIVDSMVQGPDHAGDRVDFRRPRFLELLRAARHDSSRPGREDRPRGAVLVQGTVRRRSGRLGYGSFLTVLLNFVILAFIIFWMVKLISRAKVKLDAVAPPVPEDVLLLREIRDSLKRP